VDIDLGQAAIPIAAHPFLFLSHVAWRTTTMDVESLIRTLRAYGASVDATAVRTALDNEHDNALRDWVSLHVAPDTLLSVDELNQ
jgi:hypothetical protein